ncbi:hypothetical protein Ddc_23614 [Ditylenchus destructor]|nr:hypothetical protein Ddc_23614 [Ditylenchus destructor]
MESITYLWRGGSIDIHNSRYRSQIVAEDFQLILNSPTILQCRELYMYNAHFSFKDYKVLYTVNVLEIRFFDQDEIDLWQQYWQQFLEQPGIKPIVVFSFLARKNIDNLLGCLFKGFSSAVSPNAFKIVFVHSFQSLTEIRKTNKVSGEKLELKKGLPTEFRKENLKEYNNYTLERSSI